MGSSKVARFVLAAAIGVVWSVPASAQYLEVSIDQLSGLMGGAKKAVLIDVRSPEEYRAGHIPGAINLPAERIKAEAAKLPRDKSTTLVFYCRGAG